MKVKTDNKWRYFKYGYELPNQKKWRKEHDWLIPEEFDDERFVYYHKWWYALSEFIRTKDATHMLGWEGYAADTYFTATVIKISKDGERYKIGYAVQTERTE